MRDCIYSIVVREAIILIYPAILVHRDNRG